MTRMTNTTSIIDRLLKLADSKGITQKQLAKSIGVNPQTITNWKARSDGKATSIPADKLALCAQLLDCSADYLLGLTTLQNINVPIQAITIRTDGQLLGREDPNKVAGVLISTHYFSAKAFGYIVQDESSLPAFKPGDEIIVDPDIPPVPGSHVLAIVDGAVYLRKFRSPRISKISLFAINLDYPSFEEPENQITILGTVVEHRNHQ